MNCDLCELSKQSAPVQGARFSTIDTTKPIDIMVVGDFPHDEEAANRRPFTGKLGIQLANLLKNANIPIESVYVTTLVKCRPIAPNHLDGRIKKSHVTACSMYLIEEIANINPKLIILLGESVFRFFYPDLNFSDNRGKVLKHPMTGINTITTYHPLAMISSTKFDQIISTDFTKAHETVYGVKSENKESKKDYKFVTWDRKDPIGFLRKIVERVKTVDAFSFDIETHGEGYFSYKLLSIGISWKEHTGIAIPIWVRDEIKYNALKAVADFEPEDHYLIETKTLKNGTVREKKTKIKGLIAEDFVKMSDLLPDEYAYVLNHETKAEIRNEINAILDKEPPMKKYWGSKHAEVMNLLGELMATDTPKIAHNGGYDVNRLRGIGINVKNYAYDTILMHHMLDEERPHGLDDLSYVYTKDGGYKSEKNVYLASSKTSWANIPTDVLLPYNAQDADVTLQLFNTFKAEIQKTPKRWDLFMNLVMPAQRMLVDMSFRGSRIDMDWVNRTLSEYHEKMNDMKIEIQQLVAKVVPNVYIVDSPEEEKEDRNRLKIEAKSENREPVFPTYLNINSTQQLIDLFVNYYHAQLTKQTKSGVALDSDVLNKLKKKFPVADVLLQYKALKKLESTYLIGLVERVDTDGKIHTEYKCYGTVTSRLASSNPNLQNVPSEMKPMFVPPKGYICVNVDQSAAELHVLAFLAQDRKMMTAFENHEDLHKVTACSIFNKKPEEITHDERQIAKKINFMVAYAVSGKGLADQLTSSGIPMTEGKANKYIAKWRETYSRCAALLDRSASDFIRYGLLETPFGRRRHKFKKFMSQEREAAAARQACNFPIQSTASDIQLSEMVHMYPTLLENGVLPVFTVHDSIVMYCPINKLEWLRDYYNKETCRRFPEIKNLLMYTEMEVGRNYGEHIKLPYDVDFAKWKEENAFLFENQN